MKVSTSTVEEMRALVGSGDLDLAERRETFQSKQKRPTTLNDDQLLAAVAATDDDDDDLFCNNVIEIEKNGVQLM